MVYMPFVTNFDGFVTRNYILGDKVDRNPSSSTGSNKFPVVSTSAKKDATTRKQGKTSSSR